MQNKVILNTKYSLALAFCALKSAFTLTPHDAALQMYHKVSQSGVREGRRGYHHAPLWRRPVSPILKVLRCQILIFLFGYFCCYV